MVIINLLPEKAKVREVITMYIGIGVAAVILVIVGFAVLAGSASAELADVTAKKNAIDAKLASPELKQILTQVKKFTASKANLKKSAEVLRKLRERQTVWISIMDLLPDVMPAKATLLKVANGKGKKKGMTAVTLTLWGEDREVIPKLYSNLEARQEVSNVSIDAVETAFKIIGGVEGRGFTISFDYVGG